MGCATGIFNTGDYFRMFELLILCGVRVVLIHNDSMKAIPNPLKSIIKKYLRFCAGGGGGGGGCTLVEPMQKCFQHSANSQALPVSTAVPLDPATVPPPLAGMLPEQK